MNSLLKFPIYLAIRSFLNVKHFPGLWCFDSFYNLNINNDNFIINLNIKINININIASISFNIVISGHQRISLLLSMEKWRIIQYKIYNIPHQR